MHQNYRNIVRSKLYGTVLPILPLSWLAMLNDCHSASALYRRNRDKTTTSSRGNGSMTFNAKGSILELRAGGAHELWKYQRSTRSIKQEEGSQVCYQQKSRVVI